jgi:hypothetical protein
MSNQALKSEEKITFWFLMFAEQVSDTLILAHQLLNCIWKKYLLKEMFTLNFKE